MKKPYSESCDQNREAILSVISPLLANVTRVLEIGSGTGQHAIYFAEKMPFLDWQASDCAANLAGINLWLDEAKLSNVLPPFELNVSITQWPELEVDAVFTANSVHIMNQNDTGNLIRGSAGVLSQAGSFIIYGPFNYHGQYTSESNARFDQWLKDRDPQSGIKHFENILLSAKNNGLELVNDYPMPANNRILHFRKV